MTEKKVEIPLHRVSPLIWIASSWTGSLGFFVLYLVASGNSIGKDEYQLPWTVVVTLACMLISSPLAIAYRQLSRVVIFDNNVYISKSYLSIKKPKPFSTSDVEFAYSNGTLKITKSSSLPFSKSSCRLYQFYVDEPVFNSVVDDALREGAVIRGVSYEFADAINQLRQLLPDPTKNAIESHSGTRLVRHPTVEAE